MLVYGDVSSKEDVVLNAIELLTAREEQVANLIGKSTALNVVHSYLNQALRTAQSRAVEEGAAYTALACNTPTRATNIVEHIAIPFTVSRTQSAISHYQGGNELERQTQLALFLSAWGPSPVMAM